MTEERLRALHSLVASVQEWADTPMLEQYRTPMERRLLKALAVVQACGADVAVVQAQVEAARERRVAELPEDAAAAFDPERGLLRLYGIWYSLDLFNMLGDGGLAVGAVVEIMERVDGAVTLRRLYGGGDEAV